MSLFLRSRAAIGVAAIERLLALRQPWGRE
jgi:hypothetical protein